MLVLQDMFDNANPHQFVKHSTETRAKMSQNHNYVRPIQNKKHSPESIAKMSEIKTGKKASAETRAKMSKSQKGIPKPKWSAERRAQLSALKATPVMTPHGLFPSVRAVAETSGVLPSTVRIWFKKFPDQYYYVKEVA